MGTDSSVPSGQDGHRDVLQFGVRVHVGADAHVGAQLARRRLLHARAHWIYTRAAHAAVGQLNANTL